MLQTTAAAEALRGRRALVLASVAGLVALSAAGAAAIRAWFGITFSSDTFSYLVWADRAVNEGETGHVQFDFTAPKPLELFVATVGEVVGAPIAVFGWWAVLTWVLTIAAAAALAGRIAGARAAVAAGVLTLTLPGLVRQGFSADSTVPYSACVVGAAAIGAGRPAASALLGLGGLIRPETWGIAAISAALGWRASTPRERAFAVAATVVPPAVWVTFDWLATGDPLYGNTALERFGVRAFSVTELPSLLERILPRDAGWLVVALALVGLVLGLRRRSLDAAVVFPLAIAVGLLLQIELEMVGRQSFYRYVVALLVFAAVGAGVVLALLPGRVGLAALAVGLGLAVFSASDRLERIYRFERIRGSVAAELEGEMGTAARTAIASGGLVATERPWQGGLALLSGTPRERIVPATAVGGLVDTDDVRAYLVLPRKSARLAILAGRDPSVRGTRWLLFARD